VRKFSRLIVLPEISEAGGRNMYSLSTDLSRNEAQISHAKGISMTVPTSSSTVTRAYAVAARRAPTSISSAKTASSASSR
jgi:hypothetical protein